MQGPSHVPPCQHRTCQDGARAGLSLVVATLDRRALRKHQGPASLPLRCLVESSRVLGNLSRWRGVRNAWQRQARGRLWPRLEIAVLAGLGVEGGCPGGPGTDGVDLAGYGTRLQGRCSRGGLMLNTVGTPALALGISCLLSCRTPRYQGTCWPCACRCKWAANHVRVAPVGCPVSGKSNAFAVFQPAIAHMPVCATATGVGNVPEAAAAVPEPATALVELAWRTYLMLAVCVLLKLR